MGRPSLYTPEMADRICEVLALGKSMRVACDGDDMPCESAAWRWLSQYDDFKEKYARAKMAAADVYAEEILQIADDGSNDTYKDADGLEKVNHDHIQRSKLRVDSRKWLSSKLAPKKYGDRMDIGNADGKPFATSSDDDLRAELAALRAKHGPDRE